jgi:predicted site-specific integrase-resolvase
MIVIDNVKMYDSKEVAEMLQVTEYTITKYRTEGKLLSVNIGRKKYTAESEIKRYLRGWKRK